MQTWPREGHTRAGQREEVGEAEAQGEAEATGRPRGAVSDNFISFCLFV